MVENAADENAAGFWDVVTPTDAVRFVLQRPQMSAEELARHLTSLAVAKKSRDNTTVVLIRLNARRAPNADSMEGAESAARQ